MITAEQLEQRMKTLVDAYNKMAEQKQKLINDMAATLGRIEENRALLEMLRESAPEPK